MNESGDYRCWRGCGETGTLLLCWWECKLVQPLWKTVWRFLKKLKIDLPYDPAIALLGIYTRDTGVLMHKGHLYPNVYSSTLNNSQIMERAKMSINWWMYKEDVVYIYNGMLLGSEKEWNHAICSNVDRTGRYYAEWNKSVREGQIWYVFTHMWILRNWTEGHGGRIGEKIVKTEREGGKS